MNKGERKAENPRANKMNEYDSVKLLYPLKIKGSQLVIIQSPTAPNTQSNPEFTDPLGKMSPLL